MSTQRSTLSKIPLVNLGELALDAPDAPSEGEWSRVVQELREAFMGVGFVYLTHHGFPKKQIAEVFGTAQKFFNLPQETKERYSTTSSEDLQGYVAMGRENLGNNYDTNELRECYYVKYVDRLLPDAEVPEFRQVMTAFNTSCRALSRRLLLAMARALDIDPNFFTSAHHGMLEGEGPTMTNTALNYYPPINSTNTTRTHAIRCGAHTDYGILTLLFQDGMGGLQIRDTSGSWVNAAPIPGTILVNAGDMLQFWTAGKFVATEHRVIIPEEELRQRTHRQSVAFFIQPDPDVVIAPLDGSTSFTPITAKDHIVNKVIKGMRDSA